MTPSIYVFSRKEAKHYADQTHTSASVVISITDVDKPYNDIRCSAENKIRAILHLKFDDVGDCQNNRITEQDAFKIVDFTDMWKDKVNTIIVHCEAGVSRSAGVAAAILKWTQNRADLIFNSPYFLPNRFCYREVLSAFRKREQEQGKNDICLSVCHSSSSQNETLSLVNTFKKWHDVLHSSSLIQAMKLIEKADEMAFSGCKIAPKRNDFFRALELTHPECVKIVIVGQDPYHTPSVANGLAFAVNSASKFPPSLQNIFKELKSDMGIDIPNTGDLSTWAKRGVLLLNTVLTVYEGEANSCADWGWQDFTKDVLKACFSLPQPIVFVAWGRQAQNLINKIQKECNSSENKMCIKSSHPSPLGAHKPCGDSPAFIGSKPFSTANKLLIEMGSTPVDWKLD